MRKITTKLIILIMLCASISQAAPLWNILSVNTNTHSINLTNEIIDMSRVTSLKIPYNTSSNDAARVDYVNTAISNITPASIGAVSNTALGIANAGGVTNGGIVYNGTPLNNGSSLTIVTNQFALSHRTGLVETVVGSTTYVDVSPSLTHTVLLSHRTGLVETVVGDTTYVDVTDTLQSVVTRNGTVNSGIVTIDQSNLRTNTFGGYLVNGPRRYQANGGVATGDGSWANNNSTANGEASWANYYSTADGVGGWANFGGSAIGNGSWANYSGIASGDGSWANYSGIASGESSWANYGGTASGFGSWAMGAGANASNILSFAWNEPSHGPVTFNIGVPSLFYLGNTNLQTYLDSKISTNPASIYNAGGLTNETDTLQSVVTRNGNVNSGIVTIDSLNLRTNTFGGLLVNGPRRYQAYESIASGDGSWAMTSSSASGIGSWAMYGATASGIGSWAMTSSSASGIGSWAMYGATASGIGSWAMGDGATASHNYSFAWDTAISHGNSTFNIGVPSLFYLGNTNLQTYLDSKVSTNPASVAAAGGLTNETDTLQSVVTRGNTATSATIATNITSIIKPDIDSTNAIRVTNSNGATNIITIDTLSGKVRIGESDTNYNFSVQGDFYLRGSPAPLGLGAVANYLYGGLGGNSISSTSTKAGAGGNILMRGGNAGYTAKTWTGSGGAMAAGGYIFFSGGIGGDLCKSNTGIGTAGSGGDLYNYGGNGGRQIPGTATIGGAGGDGGLAQLVGGSGGEAGNANQITSATLTGGNGGGFSGYGGLGGYAAYGTSTITGGNGGACTYGGGGGGQALGLGIGTTTVATAGNGGALQFRGGTGGSSYLATTATGGSGGNVIFSPGGPGFSDQTGYNNNYGNVYFGRYNAGNPPTTLYMAMNGYSGNVGIGADASTDKLYVLGSVTVTSNLTVNGSVISSSIVSNTAIGIANASGMTNNSFSVNGTLVGTGSNVVVITASITNELATTNFVNAISATSYYVTNTLVISNSLDFAITGLAANNIKVRYLNMFLSATNEAATSKRATFKIYNSSARLDDSLVYFDTNQLYWSSLNTTTVAAGSTTCTVSDASGVIIPDRYAVGNGATFDFLSATQTTATVITWASTNKYAITPSTKVSHANYLTPIFYDDDSLQNSMWCRFAWVTPYTGTVQVIMRYGK